MRARRYSNPRPSARLYELRGPTLLSKLSYGPGRDRSHGLRKNSFAKKRRIFPPKLGRDFYFFGSLDMPIHTRASITTATPSRAISTIGNAELASVGV